MFNASKYMINTFFRVIKFTVLSISVYCKVLLAVLMEIILVFNSQENSLMEYGEYSHIAGIF